MIIEIRRHGDWDRNTGKLTSKSKKKAERMSKKNTYDKVLSGSHSLRCVQTAEIFSKKTPIIEPEFADIDQGVNIRKRMSEVFQSIILHSSVKEHILIIGHNNLIAAISYFLDGKEIPKNLDDLPVIPYLKGIRINISKQKL